MFRCHNRRLCFVDGVRRNNTFFSAITEIDDVAARIESPNRRAKHRNSSGL